MDIGRIKKGMLVESKYGVGRVLVVDETTQAVLLEGRESQQQFAAHIDELLDNPQLHQGCDKYY
ncbi:hypothetical protein OH458_12810 [Vibrio sp. MarTm2]|jgi:hypothetical protein|uniref:Malate dehydrogenase n=2 Tax=Vibrio TaxID=662 RepID=A0A0A5HUH9_PHOS4|nr:MULTISPECIES: hypothetical protein [Vibrio]EED26692.1 conserved hypothetical protein [Vibrio sp. 16]KGY07955.1 malate dehydrogenase [Vibrio sinaloensis]KHA59599.1 malate dehydrogenase [Vibrio variabilis]KHT38330.1 malate dehydrogenase [Vibrio sinaloensis]KHT45501.1 malate dehydrogenase [Vibrio sinaloensis]